MATYGAPDDQQRLIAKIARMYHERQMRQSEIAAELHISQPRVSRLLKRAVELGIVRTTVTLPPGVHTDLEDALEERYGLGEAIVVDATGSEADIVRSLASAAAVYLDTTLIGGESVGISSWSATLLAAVEMMRQSPVQTVERVVQIVGGVGNPGVQVQATRLIGTFAERTGADAMFMPAPGLLGSPGARDSLMNDPAVAVVTDEWNRLTTALVGIGSLEPSPLLRESGNAVATVDEDTLRAAGAVGDVCLRFYDAAGDLVQTEIDARVVGISPDELRRIPRRVAVAGGPRKLSAVRGAVLGKWITVLVTDAEVARGLLAAP
ncbi:DNA-binding transcriptional regulator [Actinomycetota bacterium]|nr:DNA-binding transcriptional regulator [Actinomycetota bacterium]